MAITIIVQIRMITAVKFFWRGRIGNNVQIGSGVNIIGPITVGDNSIIGAGSLIDKDIPANSIAYNKRKTIIVKRKKE